MRNNYLPSNSWQTNAGMALLELVVALSMLAVLLGVAVTSLQTAIEHRADPVIYARAVQLAQDTIDAIMTRKFDENTPPGGVPHCDAGGAPACAGVTAGDSGLDDIGDFNGMNDSTSAPPFLINVTVADAGTELSLVSAAARRITVTVSIPSAGVPITGLPLVLSTYRFNY
jgi:MSHA pilin protein MshD